MMKKMIPMMAMIIFLVFLAGFAFGQELVIFPARGQTPEQMEKDKSECYTWAKQETGFDPMQAKPAQAPPAQPQGPQGERIKGAARGGGSGGCGWGNRK